MIAGPTGASHRLSQRVKYESSVLQGVWQRVNVRHDEHRAFPPGRSSRCCRLVSVVRAALLLAWTHERTDFERRSRMDLRPISLMRTSLSSGLASSCIVGSHVSVSGTLEHLVPRRRSQLTHLA
jgi:hypothetical protein